MLSANYRNRPQLLSEHPKLVEALDDILAALNNVSTLTAAAAQGETPAPQPVSLLTVSSAGGVFELAIDDNSPVFRGVQYFVEYSTSPSFSQPTVIPLGASRNKRTFLGNQTLYFRAYSSYPTGPSSRPVYHGSSDTPTPVVGGGAISGPSLLPSRGSGTAPNSGLNGGSGFGRDLSRGGQGGRGPAAR